MIGTVLTLFRPARLAAAATQISLLALGLAPWHVASAYADHGGPLRSAPMSPALVGVLAGALTLAAVFVVIVIARLVVKKRPPAE